MLKRTGLQHLILDLDLSEMVAKSLQIIPNSCIASVVYPELSQAFLFLEALGRKFFGQVVRSASVHKPEEVAFGLIRRTRAAGTLAHGRIRLRTVVLGNQDRRYDCSA